MVGNQIKYEPAWNHIAKKEVLKHTAVNDCLSSTAGLTEHSMGRVKKNKREQKLATMSRVSAGDLGPEEVGLKRRFSSEFKMKGISNSATRTQRARGRFTLTDRKYSNKYSSTH